MSRGGSATLPLASVPSRRIDHTCNHLEPLLLGATMLSCAGRCGEPLPPDPILATTGMIHEGVSNAQRRLMLWYHTPKAATNSAGVASTMNSFPSFTIFRCTKPSMQVYPSSEIMLTSSTCLFPRGSLLTFTLTEVTPSRNRPSVSVS